MNGWRSSGLWWRINQVNLNTYRQVLNYFVWFRISQTILLLFLWSVFINRTIISFPRWCLTSVIQEQCWRNWPDGTKTCRSQIKHTLVRETGKKKIFSCKETFSLELCNASNQQHAAAFELKYNEIENWAIRILLPSNYFCLFHLILGNYLFICKMYRSRISIHCSERR